MTVHTHTQYFDDSLKMDPMTYVGPDTIEEFALWYTDYWQSAVGYDLPEDSIVTLNTGVVDGKTEYYMVIRYADGTFQADTFKEGAPS